MPYCRWWRSTEFSDVALFEIAGGGLMIPIFLEVEEAIGAVVGSAGALLSFEGYGRWSGARGWAS